MARKSTKSPKVASVDMDDDLPDLDALLAEAYEEEIAELHATEQAAKAQEVAPPAEPPVSDETCDWIRQR